jgi:hypothetical protein
LPYVENVDLPQAPPDAELSPRAWAERWGFGIATSVGVVSPSAPRPDPNLEYVATLSPSQAEQYRTALYGSSTEPGCADQAADRVYGRYEQVLDPLGPEIDQMEQAIRSDTRTITLTMAWLECVSDDDFRPSSREALVPELTEVLQAKLAEVMGPPPGRSDFDTAELRAIQRREIELALRTIDCDTRFEHRFSEVRAEHERAFISAHEDELVEVRTQMDAIERSLRLAPASPSPAAS